MKSTLIKCLKQATEIAYNDFYESKSITQKTDIAYDVVTKTDKHVENTIAKLIRETYPDHNILAEEQNTQFTSNEYTWIIDPIDGTANFSNGNPLFAISIALLKDSELIMGGVSTPMFDEIFIAEKNKGLTINNIPLNQYSYSKPVNKLSGSIITGSLVDYNAPLAFKKYGILPRSLGSAALELAWLATGRLHAVMYHHIKPWDVASGILLAKEGVGALLRGSENPYISHMYAVNKGLVSLYNGVLDEILIKPE